MKSRETSKRSGTSPAAETVTSRHQSQRAGPPDRPGQKTKRRRAAESGPPSEHDFVQAILDSTSALIVVLDLDSRIVHFNRACELASGRSADDVIGKPLWETGLIPAEEAGPLRATQLKVIAAVRSRTEPGDPVEMFESRWHHRDGRERLLAWTISRLREADGAVRHIVASAVDVTLANRDRAALSAEHALLEAILETVPAVILVSDSQGRILRFNKAAQDTTGYAASDVDGAAIFDRVLAPEDRARARRIFERILQGEFPVAAETQWVHRDGSRRQLAWNTSALTDAAGEVTHVISTAVDVTERNEAEAREQKRIYDLAHLHRLHTAGEIATVLAHEINQPLSAISAYSTAGVLAAAGTDEASARQQEIFTKIGDAALRAGRVVRDLRAFVGRNPAAVTAFDAPEALKAACVLMRGYARRRGVDIALNLHPVPRVKADPIHVEQIVLNLIRNAVEAIAGADTPGRGRITINLRLVGARARITVEDTGPGIPRGEEEKVFEAFYTNKPDGMGMGLRISRSLAEANGGLLWASRRGRGAVFHLSLPVET